jgi:hypothetical protein
MAVKDLVSGVLAESITTSTTNVLVTIAQSIGRPGILAFFPTPPFYITIMPKSPAVGVANRLDSEILQVTAVGNDQVGNAALTCVRGQRDTTAKAFEAGSIVTVGVYTDDAVLLGGTGTTETETPWIGVADIIWSQMIDKIYPVGSIFMSATLSTAAAVGNALGGTWVKWGAGRVPVGVNTSQTEFNTVEKTGGEKTHKLTTNEIPSHNHGYLDYWSVQGGSGSNKAVGYETNDGGSGIGTATVGGGAAHNNLQPYITCYMYKRTA